MVQWSVCKVHEDRRCVVYCKKQQTDMLIDLWAQRRSQSTPVQFRRVSLCQSGWYAIHACRRANASQAILQHLPLPQAHQWHHLGEVASCSWWQTLSFLTCSFSLTWFTLIGMLRFCSSVTGKWSGVDTVSLSNSHIYSLFSLLVSVHQPINNFLKLKYFSSQYETNDT